MMSGYLLLRLEIVILKKRKAYLLYEWYLPFYSSVYAVIQPEFFRYVRINSHLPVSHYIFDAGHT